MAGHLGMSRPIAALAIIGWAQVIGIGGQPVLRERALHDRHLALAAGLTAAANGLDLDAEGARSIQ
jgi:hypothetical protein